MFEDLLKEDCKQYRELAKRYLQVSTEQVVELFEIKKKAWALAQRWSDIQSNATKYAVENSISKTDFSTWAYQRYRQLQLMHEDSRMMWRMGEEELKRTENIN